MNLKHLGERIDIHGGGTDLIFPHHEGEIAQAEADTGKVFARYWLHNGMVNFGTEKMSKSLGNTLTIREIVKRHDPDALRLWMLGTHYRNQLEWSEERVAEGARALERLWAPIEQARKCPETETLGATKTQVPPSEYQPFTDRFVAAMDDDFNTPQALSVLFDFVRALNQRQRSVQDFAREVVFIAIKNGHHSGIGYFLDSGARTAPGSGPIPLTELWQRMVSAF